jgi:hypothetical protein
MKTKSGLAMPAFSSACPAASRPAMFGLWWRLVPTPALVVISVPPACWEHLSLGRFARHLSLALAGLPIVSVAIHRLSSDRREVQVGTAQPLWSDIATPVHARYRSNARGPRGVCDRPSGENGPGILIGCSGPRMRTEGVR